MKNRRIAYVSLCFLVVAALLTVPVSAGAATGRQLTDAAISSLQSVAPTTVTKNVVTLGWSWREVSFKDDTYPLTVDFVGSNFSAASKVIYLLPGGGVNFRSSFFTPMDKNLAQFFRTNGYLVVGITPREDSVTSGIPAEMAGWGMARHKADIQTVISTIQARLGKPYRVLGHSFGAAYALDYASTCKDGLFEKVIALDIYSFQNSITAAESSDYFQDLLDADRYADASYTDMKSLMLISLLLPKIDSGEPRGDFGPGNFTYEGLLYSSLIWTSEIPGIDLTDWPLVQSYAAGVYHPAWCPLFDTYSLTESDMNTVRSASFVVGSGLVPHAVYRDYFAVNGGITGTYSITWSNIRVPIVWVNTELGYGSNAYSGGVAKTFTVIAGYGHLDALLGRTAQEDVWKYFLP